MRPVGSRSVFLMDPGVSSGAGRQRHASSRALDRLDPDRKTLDCSLCTRKRGMELSSVLTSDA
ncbi:hypothetical protein GQ600_13525 [Phytophthora cactorum]|nr:hypothetical protein GQ600_13525 [Phytophthora cactorum]